MDDDQVLRVAKRCDDYLWVEIDIIIRGWKIANSSSIMIWSNWDMGKIWMTSQLQRAFRSKSGIMEYWYRTTKYIAT